MVENIDHDDIFVISIFNFSFTVTLVVIGRKYSNDCPINPKIPHSLVVGSCMALTAIILFLVQGVIAAYFIKPPIKATEDNCRTFVLALSLRGIANILFFLLYGVLVDIIGKYSIVIEVWHKVQYIEPALLSYCHPTLYRFTYCWVYFTFGAELIILNSIRKKFLQ